VIHRLLRAALVAGALLAWSAPSRAGDLAPAPDWTLSDADLFEVIKAETSKSTVGHERSVHSGPVDHCDVDEPGPEPFPSPERAASTKPAPEKVRLDSRVAAPYAALRSPVSVPLRL
jgi:hypothetical protein